MEKYERTFWSTQYLENVNLLYESKIPSVSKWPKMTYHGLWKILLLRVNETNVGIAKKKPHILSHVAKTLQNLSRKWSVVSNGKMH